MKGVSIFREYVDWTADGKGQIVSHSTAADPELLCVDLHGHRTVLWRVKPFENVTVAIQVAPFDM